MLPACATYWPISTSPSVRAKHSSICHRSSHTRTNSSGVPPPGYRRASRGAYQVGRAALLVQPAPHPVRLAPGKRQAQAGRSWTRSPCARLSPDIGRRACSVSRPSNRSDRSDRCGSCSHSSSGSSPHEHAVPSLAAAGTRATVHSASRRTPVPAFATLWRFSWRTESRLGSPLHPDNPRRASTRGAEDARWAIEGASRIRKGGRAGPLLGAQGGRLASSHHPGPRLPRGDAPRC